MQTYSSGSARQTFFETGKGTPAVFLHPTPLDHSYWLPMLQRLTGVRAIAPDFRGHGSSELGTLPAGAFARVPDAPVLSMARLAQDVLALLDHLQIEQAIFVGCSVGGYALLELWRQAPERMRGLAFICSKPQPDAEANLEKRSATIARVRAGQSAAVMDGMAQTLIGASAQARRPAIVSELRACMTLTPEALIATQAGLAARPDSIPTVATISVPVLAIAGGEDAGIPLEDLRAFERAPGGCALHQLPRAGHFAAYEEPEAVAGITEDWLHSIIR